MRVKLLIWFWLVVGVEIVPPPPDIIYYMDGKIETSL